jgi:hypothetical protein
MPEVSDLITGVCEPPCGCWDLNSGPAEEQSVFLPAEPPHQPPAMFFYKGQTVNIFDFAAQAISNIVIRPCQCIMKAATDNMEINEYGC